MSSYFDEASLVMIPSGYKNQKVYSVKPLDGSGDLTFSRASSATRVASNGLIEKVRTNLALRSQSFATTAVWSTVSGSITDNAGTAPDGTNTASKIVAGNADPYVYQSLTPSAQVTLSCYVKGIGSSIGKTARIICNADLTDVIMDGTWQRISVTHTPSGTEIYGLEIPNPAVSGDEVLLWGFQVEYGDIATDYIATTSAAVSVGPVSGLPRLDYLNSTCPRLLLEPQRSSLVTYSEQQDNAAWTKAGATITTNATASPDGYTNADKVVEDTSGGGTHGTYQSASVTSGTTYTWSGFFKAAERTAVEVAAQTSGTYNAKFNLSNGTVISVDSGATASVVNYGNGWYRCIISAPTASTTAFFNWWMLNSSNQGVYTGNGTSGVFAWGCQLEAGAYATSYIPTLGTSVTRVADLAQKTSASALIGQTEGTVYWEIEVFTAPNVGAEDILVVDNGAATNLLYISKSFTDNSLIADMYVSSVRQAFFQTSALSLGIHKAAIAYANNNTAFFVDGVQVGTTDTSCSVPAMSRIQLGNGVLGPSVNKTAQLLLFKTRLTNAQLAELTTL